MVPEKEIIGIMDKILPSARSCRLFEYDAEPVNLKGGHYCISIDEFSGEDHFSETDLCLLGWNLAAGAISDLLACNAKPLYLLHAFTAKISWEREDISNLSRGIADAMNAAGIRLLGGDCGLDTGWRYTATVLGEARDRKLSRAGARPGDAIYMTGKTGEGNVEAALSLAGSFHLPGVIPEGQSFRIPLRLDESRLIADHASTCIDTSDGVCSALETISRLNATGYEVTSLPYCERGAVISAAMRLPILLLFLGGCGEYELLFTIPRDQEDEFSDKARKAGFTFHRLGTITKMERKIIEGGKSYDLSTFDIDARSFPNHMSYLKRVVDWIQQGK